MSALSFRIKIVIASILGTFSCTVSAQSSPPIAQDPILPVLGTADPTWVIFSAGLLPRGSSEFTSTPSANEFVTVAAQIEPAPEHVNQFADLFMVVQVTRPAGFTALLQKNSSGQFVPWNGNLTELVPVQEDVLMSEAERLEVYSGRMAPGQYRLYFGYSADIGLIYTRTPLTIDVK